jgi:hypothetical protein
VPDITIRFRSNPKTGKRELVISYESDSDALAHEHERDHRAMVESLIGAPIGEDTDIVVERLDKSPTGPSAERREEDQKRQEAIKNRG